MTKNFICKLGSAFLIFILLTAALPINILAYAVDLSQSKVFKVDYFDADFAPGYIKNNAPATGHGSGMTEVQRAEDWGIDFYILSNTSKDANIYMDFANAAVYNGVSYDVRMYTWLDHAYGDGGIYGVYTNKIGIATYPVLRGTENGNALETNSIHVELHFYRSGSLASGNPQEVSWEGVVRFADLDTNEGYIFENNSCNCVYTASAAETTISHSLSFYYGTRTVNYGGTAGDDSNYNGAIWAELGSAPSRPLTLQYRTSGRFGSEIGYQGVTVKYNLVGTVPAGVTNWPNSYVAEYSNVNVQPAPTCSNAVTNANYTFSGWYTNSNFTGSPVTATTVTNTDRNLYGRYTRTAYTVTTSRSGSGTITASRNGITSGSNYTVSFAPSAGYYVASVTVDGVAQTNPNSLRNYTFSNIKADHEISVVFKPLLTLTTSATNGTISRSDNAIVPGSNRTVTFTPNDGYYLSSLRVNGTNVSITPTTTSYTLNNITANQTVDAIFSPLFMIDTSVVNGTITEDQSNLYPNSEATIRYTANDGCYLAGITVDGAAVNYSNFLSEYVFSNITSNHTINVVYNPYLALTTSANNGVISSGDIRIREGENRTVTFTPNAGHALRNLTVNSEPVDIDRLATSYTVNDIRENTDVVANFEPVYEITTEVIGGTISDNVDNIFAGETASVSYAPEGDNELQFIVVDGEYIDTTGIEDEYIFSDIQGNHNIQVVYNGIGNAAVHFVDADMNELADAIVTTDYCGETVGSLLDVENKIDELISIGYEMTSRDTFETEIFSDTPLDFYIVFEPIIEEITVEEPKTEQDIMNPDGTSYPTGLDLDSLTTELTRTIEYVYEETGETAAESVVQTVLFTRTGFVNHVTGEVWYSDYETDEIYEEVVSPVIRNFTASLDVVPSRVTTYEDGPLTEICIYAENLKQISNLLFVDGEGNSLADTLTVIGHPEEAILYEYDSIVESIENLGYILVENEYEGTEVFDDNYEVNQNFYLVFEPLIITYTVNNEGIAGTPANPNRPDGPVVPEKLTSDDFTYVVNRTINYVYDISSPRFETNPVAAESVVQRTTITREATVNYVTMEVVYSEWEVPEVILEEKISPVIENFTADRDVDALTSLEEDIEPNKTLELTETVVYTPKTSNVIIRFLDEDGNQLLDNLVYMGNFETPFILDNRVEQNITRLTSNSSYTLTRNETTNLQIFFTSGDQVFNVVFKKTAVDEETAIPATGEQVNGFATIVGILLLCGSIAGIAMLLLNKVNKPKKAEKTKKNN